MLAAAELPAIPRVRVNPRHVHAAVRAAHQLVGGTLSRLTPDTLGALVTLRTGIERSPYEPDQGRDAER